MQLTAYILLVKLMRIYKISEIKNILPAILFTLFAIFAVLFIPKATSQGVKTGIDFCLSVLVPSLFPFMVISSFVVNSGIYVLFTKPFERICKKLFKLPGYCSSVIILSLIGGYPVGARSIGNLYSKGAINETQAKKMAYFCVCSGPGFLITFVGSTLYDNVQIGVILLISSLISATLCGILAGIVIKDKTTTSTNNSNLEQKRSIKFSQAFTKSATDASKATIDMCVMVVIFNVLISVLESFINNESFKHILYVMLEVTTACNKICNYSSVILVAFAVGFGGLCVHFQIFQGITNININKKLFFLFRIIQGLLTALVTKLILYFTPITTEVFSTTQNATAVISSTNYFGSIMLIITAVCFLYSIKTSNNKSGG